MNKDELKKEAEENSFRYTLDKPWACEVERKQIMTHFEKGYLAGAEPREKRIAELIALINAERERQEKCDDVHLRKIAELEKENAKLEKDFRICEHNADTYYDQLTKAKELLKEFVQHYKNKTIYVENMQDLLEQSEQFIKDLEK